MYTCVYIYICVCIFQCMWHMFMYSVYSFLNIYIYIHLYFYVNAYAHIHVYVKEMEAHMYIRIFRSSMFFFHRVNGYQLSVISYPMYQVIRLCVAETHSHSNCMLTAAVCVCVTSVVIDAKLPLLAGGARDAHWTGTNEDASVSSVISMGALIDVPAFRELYTVMARG